MDNSFEYSYSAKSHREVEEIRRKYVTDENDSYESKLRQLKDLDRSASRKGMIVSISVGTVSTMLLGLGMSCIMVWNDPFFILGIVLGVLGLIGVCASYPLFQHITKKERKRIAPMILKLSEELEKMSS
ncbi:MAG: hypothetical protein LUC90_03805 [Lachnospiraceae bacterium]|nr:hypothetical protein [Lachnospiraceae bacterium]